jgi:hypothetical protein
MVNLVVFQRSARSKGRSRSFIISGSRGNVPGILLVTDGLTDIRVPYLQSKRMLDQVPDYGAPGRLQFRVYPGGVSEGATRSPRAAI